MDPQEQLNAIKELSPSHLCNSEPNLKGLSQCSHSHLDSDSSFSLDEQGHKKPRNEPYGPIRARGKHGLKYAKISNDMREALINQVTSTGCTIKSAAQKLGINFSTAKAIMQIFKKEGRSCKKVIRKNRKRRTSLGKKHSKYLKDTSSQQESKEELQKSQLKEEWVKQQGTMSLTDLEDSNKHQQAIIQQLTSQNVHYQGQIQTLFQEKVLLAQKYQSLAQQYACLEAMMQQVIVSINYPSMTKNYVA